MRTALVGVPIARPIVSSVRRADVVIDLLVEVLTEEGTGVAYVAGFTENKARSLRLLVEELGAEIAGMRADGIDAAWRRMWSSLTLVGHSGLAAFALSAIDIALWDLRGKRAHLPLYRLLGGSSAGIQAYASDGCWLGGGPDKVAAEAAAFVAEGFRSVKIRFGRQDQREDYLVLEAVRHAVGDGVELMVDVNQGWSRDRARLCGSALAEARVRWLEEPLAAEDVDGLGQLRRELAVEIAAGENAYFPAGIEALVKAKAASVLMPDLQRIGGITGWLRAHDLAQEAGLLLSPHLFPEINVHLLASIADPGPLEYVTWAERILREPLAVRNGRAAPPDRPGLGIEFDGAAVQRLRLD